jgi:hypothetical protein
VKLVERQHASDKVGPWPVAISAEEGDRFREDDRFWWNMDAWNGGENSAQERGARSPGPDDEEGLVRFFAMKRVIWAGYTALGSRDAVADKRGQSRAVHRFDVSASQNTHIRS